MTETPDEREARQDAELAALEGRTPTPAPTPETPAASEPKRDRDGDLVYPFTVSGTLDAENLNDAYKLLQAHFLALSRGSMYDAPSEIHVSVAPAA